MDGVESQQIPVDADASNYAFTVGQQLEADLIDASIVKAKSRGLSSVTIELIEESLSELTRNGLARQPDGQKDYHYQARAA